MPRDCISINIRPSDGISKRGEQTPGSLHYRRRFIAILRVSGREIRTRPLSISAKATQMKNRSVKLDFKTLIRC